MGFGVIAGAEAEISGRKVLLASILFLRNRAYQLNAFRRWCKANNLNLNEVDRKKVVTYAKHLQAKGGGSGPRPIAPQSVTQHVTSILDYLDFCAARRWRRGPRIKRRSIVLHPRGSEEAWYTESKILSFIGELGTSGASMGATIMYRMGLRISETLNLQISDFPSIERYRSDPNARRLVVTGKNGKIRRVFFSESLLRDIHDYILYDRPHYEARLSVPTKALLLGRTRGARTGPLTARRLQKEFQVVCARTSFSHITPHRLRHHFAAHYLLRAALKKQNLLNLDIRTFDVSIAGANLSLDIIILMDMLGHSQIETTMKYLKALGALIGSFVINEYQDSLDDERH